MTAAPHRDNPLDWIIPTEPLKERVGRTSRAYALAATANALGYIVVVTSRDVTVPLVSLAAGQTQNAVVTVKRGYLLQVRVNDPGAVLSSAIGKPGGPGVVMRFRCYGAGV